MAYDAIQVRNNYEKKVSEFCTQGFEPSLEDEAKMFAQAVELSCLKSPLTAIFPPLEEMQMTEVTPGNYKVSGYVDSQNSYGAVIRTPFNISVTKADGEWKCTDTFISTEAKINSQIAGRTVLWWVLGLAVAGISTLITFISLDIF